MPSLSEQEKKLKEFIDMVKVKKQNQDTDRNNELLEPNLTQDIFIPSRNLLK